MNKPIYRARVPLLLIGVTVVLGVLSGCQFVLGSTDAGEISPELDPPDSVGIDKSETSEINLDQLLLVEDSSTQEQAGEEASEDSTKIVVIITLTQ